LIRRVVYAVASGWWVDGLLCLVMFAGQILMMGVPVVDRYCAKRVSFPPMVVNGVNGDSRGLSGLSIRKGCHIS
jgi:hypothetical protein